MERINYYIAVERGTAMYSGYAKNTSEFENLCKEQGFDLEGCEIEEVHHNVKPIFGRMPQKGVRKDLGKL